MSNVKANESGVIVPCSSCGKKNRIPFDRAATTAQCGSCGTDMAASNAPINIENDAAFDKLVSASQVPVVVDFWAPWCQPCRSVAPEFEKVAASSGGRYLVAKVDTEALPTLGGRFQIRSIPAMVVFSNGSEIARTAGARPANAIDAFVRQSLSQPHTPAG